MCEFEDYKQSYTVYWTKTAISQNLALIRIYDLGVLLIDNVK